MKEDVNIADLNMLKWWYNENNKKNRNKAGT